MKVKVFSFLSLFILCIAPIAAAQGDCPALVDAALNAANEACLSLGRNQACYGNVMLEVTPREDASAFTFEQAGDVVDVANIESLQLSSMSLADETWGIALMQLQANLPDTLPGQNVTVLLFGDVQLANRVNEVVELDATASANVNVRLRPRSDQDNIIASLTRNQDIIANGRLEDSSWIRIVLDGDTRQVGWVSADFVSSDADLATLAVVEGGAPLYAPMQAFYFASSIGDSRCDEAPDSGILIQTPQGVGEVNLLINEVEIRLGSTIYVTAGNGAMTISVVEGHAVVTADGVTQTVPAGTYAEIPLDANGVANGTPTFPQPYNFADMQALPVHVALPQSVTIAPAAEAEDVQAAIDTASGLPQSGAWRLSLVVIEDTTNNPSCVGDGRPDTGDTPTWNTILTFSEDRQTLSFTDGWSPGSPYTMSRIGESVYQWSDGTLTLTMTLTSPTAYNFRSAGLYGGGNCTYIMEGTATYSE